MGSEYLDSQDPRVRRSTATVVASLPVWWVVAGIGLRIVRAVAHRRESVDQLVD
jgi:hypothetical protein